MRIALLGLFHEANTFSPLQADRALFASGGVFRGAGIVDEYRGSSTTIGGYLAAGERLGVEVVPLTFAFVNPIGAVTEDAFEWLAGEMLGELTRGGPWDGVLLNLHGAAVAAHLPDADAELARRVRAVVGPGVPVGAVLDLHGNASPALVDALTVTLAYQTNPHIDAAAQGARCAELVVRAARGEIAPVQVLVPLPLVVNIARQDTGEEPMASLIAAAERIAERPGMLWAGVLEGFPYADVPHVGMSCLTVHDGDLLAAERGAWELAEAVWSRRDDLQARGHTVEEALDLAEQESGPVVLLDVGDNIGAGAPGDSTVILAAAMRRGLRSLVQTLWDPEAAAACVAAGVGAEVSLSVGARHGHSAGAPVPVKGRVRVISDGRFEEPTPTHGGFRWFDMGPTAVLETTDGPALVLMSRQTMNTSRRQLTSLGLDPAAFQVVVAKGVNAPRAAYAPIASRLVVVDTDGVTAMGLERFDYRRRRRPLYPFEPAAFPLGGGPMTSAFDHVTMADVLAHRAAADGDRPFLTYADPLEPRSTRTWTYAACAAEVTVLRALLAELGVGPGDRVVLHMENAPAFVIALLAITATGAAAVPTIAQYTAEELGYVVEHSEAVAIVTNLRHQAIAERVAAAAAVKPPVVCGTTVTNGRRRAARATTRLSSGDQTPGQRTALIMYTSGTTGRPKGVMLSHAACLSAGATTRAETALTPSDRSYCVLPLFHVNAMCFQLLPTLLTGSHLVIGPVFSARAYWPVVAEHAITVGNLTAGPLRILLGAPPGPAEAEAAAFMRLMMYALPLDREEIRALETRFGVAVSMGWGLTESAACGTRTPVHLDPRHDWQSIGTVSPGWDLRVVGDDGAEVAPGGVGELVIRGPSTMSGYFRDPPATAEVLDDDGWLRTGDLGRVDGGYVIFHDRRKDVIKVKGENVGAGEVERVLLDHPLVEECAAVGVPDPILGERLLAFVVLAAGAAIEDDALRGHCAERLAPFKVPSRVVPVPELPRTSIGKIRKAGLRDLAQAFV